MASSSEAEPTRRRHRIWPWAVAGVLLVLIAALAVSETQGWPFLKGPLEQSLTQRLQRRVEFGEHFKLHLLGSVRLESDALQVGAPPWTAQAASAPTNAAASAHGDTVHAADVRLAVPYTTLLQRLRGAPGAPHIKLLRLRHLDATFRRARDGHADWTLTAEPTPPTGDAQRLQLPQIDTLVIESGHVTVDDALLRLRLDATVSTVEGDRQTHAAGLAIDGGGHYQERPFEFHVKSSGVLPLVAPADPDAAVPITVQASAGKDPVPPAARSASAPQGGGALLGAARHGGAIRAQFVGKAVDVLSLEGFDGEVTLSGPSLATVGDALGITLPTTSPFSLKGQLGKKDQRWTLKLARLDVGGSRLGGQFQFDRSPKVPLLTGELTAQRFVLADLAPAFGAAAPEAPKKTKAAGRVLPDREFDIPSLLMMNASVRLRLQRAELGTLFAEALEPLEGDLQLRDGVLRVSNLTARTAGGELHGGIELDPKPNPPAWDADLRWSGIQLGRWLRVRNERAVEAKAGQPAPGYVSGQLKGRAQLRAQGSSTARLLASLDGTVYTWVQDGRISSLMVEAIGLQVARVLGILFTGDKGLPMDCAVAQLKASGGTITPQVLVVDTPSATLLADGTISMVDERLAMTVHSEPKQLSALSLRTPVHIEGSFAQPHVRLDANPLALKVAGAALLAVVNPLAAVLPLFDTGEPQAQGCTNTLHRLRGDNKTALAFAPPAAGRRREPASPPSGHRGSGSAGPPVSPP
jgi:uncharacterized protein involved in outer membrane biogenesis